MKEGFEFIEEVLANLQQDLLQKDAAKEHVKRAFTKGKTKAIEKMKEVALEEVQNLEENYQKVIGFGRKFNF